MTEVQVNTRVQLIQRINDTRQQLRNNPKVLRDAFGPF